MSAGALAARLALDSSGFRAEMASAGTVADKELKRIGKQVQFVNDYIKEMARAQTSANQASAGIAEGARHMEHFGFQTASAKRELLVLAHELSQGNFKKFGGSLLVLGEQTGAAGLLFSGLGLAALAAVAALGSFAAAAVMGAHEDTALRNSLILTGNIAGLNAARFDTIAASSGKAAGASIGSAKESLQALVNTGRIGQESLAAANQATLLFAKLSGQSADEIAKDFAKMGDGVAKWAAEHNKQYHYLTASQYAYIKQLEDQGKGDKAAAENFRILNERMGQVNTGLGLLERAWHGIKDAASGAWDSMKGVGRAQTTTEQLADARKRLEDLQARGPLNSVPGVVSSYNKGIDNLRQQIDLLREKARFESMSADSQAQQGRQQEAGIAARQAIDAILQETKGRQLLNKEIEHYKTLFAQAAAAGAAYSKEDQDRVFAELRKKYAAPVSPYASLTIDIGKYNAETEILAGTTRKLADYEVWAAEQRAKLAKETEKLTEKERIRISFAIDGAAAMRRDAEETQKAIDMEQQMQKLLADRGLVNGPKTNAAEEKQIAATKYLNSIVDDTKSAERLVNGSFQRMEDALIDFVKTGKLSFSDLWSFMAEEYLRNMIRIAEQKLLTDKAGNAISGASIWSSIGGLFGGGEAKSHANGLSYVPYDGYPAILHKGERVQTALEASGSIGSGGGGTVVDNSGQTFNVGQGVSRGEMAAAVNQAIAASEARTKRSMRQGTFA